MIKEYILSYAPQGLGENTYNNTCPSCGRDKLSITRLEDGYILYNCFRSSCGMSGRIQPSGVIHITPTPTTRSRGNPYTGDLVSLPSEQMDMLHDAVGFAPEHFQIARPMWSNDLGRVAYPLLTALGARQGWVLRSYQGVEPKALTYLDRDSSRLSHYGSHPLQRTAVLLEDIPSAVRAAPYVNSVALLGTTVSDEDAQELTDNYDKVVIILDNDALVQAIKLKAQLSALFEEVTIAVPNKDLKDMVELELCNFLSMWTQEGAG